MSEQYEILSETIGEACDDTRLDRALALTFENLSRTRIKRLIEKGQVTLDGATIIDPTRRVKQGLEVSIKIPPPAPAIPEAQPMPLTIVYEDDDLVLVDKPAGLVVHPAPGNPGQTLVNALIAHCGPSLSGIGDVQRPGIVHRIDKDTSGLIVVAKNDLAHQGLAKQFEKHSISRAYYALAWGSIAQVKGSIEGNIGRSKGNRKKMAVLKSGGKHARTHYKVVERFGDPSQAVATLIDCRLETGRTHQIRVHFTHFGHPLVGDPLYGRGRQGSANRLGEDRSEAVSKFKRQALHARLLGFYHPRTREKMEFKSELPSDFNELIEVFRGKS
jgi:23S rRNA pseudouridine1911/1915/1917 synthase